MMMKMSGKNHLYKLSALIGAPFVLVGAVGMMIYAVLGIFMLTDLIESRSASSPDEN
jgi:preprotein translocase subunit Sss1